MSASKEPSTHRDLLDPDGLKKVLDAEAARARDQAFVEHVKAKPGFAEAVRDLDQVAAQEEAIPQAREPAPIPSEVPDDAHAEVTARADTQVATPSKRLPTVPRWLPPPADAPAESATNASPAKASATETPAPPTGRRRTVLALLVLIGAALVAFWIYRSSLPADPIAEGARPGGSSPSVALPSSGARTDITTAPTGETPPDPSAAPAPSESVSASSVPSARPTKSASPVASTSSPPSSSTGSAPAASSSSLFLLKNP